MATNTPTKRAASKPTKKAASKPAKKAVTKKATALSSQSTNSALVKIVAEGGGGSIPVNLVGKVYQVRPPKTMVAMRAAQVMLKVSALDDLDQDSDPAEAMAATGEIMDGIDTWIEHIFSTKDAADVQKRLNDPEDSLDFPHIMELMSKLPEAVGQNPTT